MGPFLGFYNSGTTRSSGYSHDQWDPGVWGTVLFAIAVVHYGVVLPALRESDWSDDPETMLLPLSGFDPQEPKQRLQRHVEITSR